jgi:hypothetical protein
MALLGTVTEDFTTLTAVWAPFGTVVFDGQCKLNAATSGLTRGADRFGYDLTGSQGLIEVPTVGATYTMFYLERDASNWLGIICTGANITAQHTIAGANTTVSTTTYSSTNHRWWQIRSSAGTIFYEASATGAAGTWTTLFSEANPFTITTMSPAMYSDNSGVVYDNFNLPPAPGGGGGGQTNRLLMGVG